jgi:hypothetical protein
MVKVGRGARGDPTRTPTVATGTDRASPRLDDGSPPRPAALERVLDPLAHQPRPVLSDAEPAEDLGEDRLHGIAGTV